MLTLNSYRIHNEYEHSIKMMSLLQDCRHLSLGFCHLQGYIDYFIGISLWLFYSLIHRVVIHINLFPGSEDLILMLQMKSVCVLLQRCIPASFSTWQVSRLNQFPSKTDKQGSFQYNCDIIASWSYFAQIKNLHPSYADHHDKNICIYHF